MNRSAVRRLILVALLALTASATSYAAPRFATTSLGFNFGTRDGSSKRDLRIPRGAGGCILVQIRSWTPAANSRTAASRLTLRITDPNGRGRDRSGSASTLLPLWISYAVSAPSQDQTWTISVMKESGIGTARGTVTIEYPPTRMPCEFTAGTSATRGEIRLSWTYTGEQFRGSFLVERSTDGETWSAVSACKKVVSQTTAYSCTDTRLRSAATYYYQACAVTSGTRCGTTSRTPTVYARAR